MCVSPEASPDCVSSRNVQEAEKHNRRILFHEHIITESLIKSSLLLFLCVFSFRTVWSEPT